MARGEHDKKYHPISVCVGGWQSTRRLTETRLAPLSMAFVLQSTMIQIPFVVYHGTPCCCFRLAKLKFGLITSGLQSRQDLTHVHGIEKSLTQPELQRRLGVS